MKFVARESAFDGVPAGATVVANNCCGTPLTLLAGLADHAIRVGDLELRAGILLGDPPLEEAIRAGALKVRSWHIHGSLRRLMREGLIDYTPVRLSAVPATVIAGVDIALVRVSPPDADGFCSLGPSTTFARAAIDAAGLVLAEVADDVPRTRGDSAVHVSRIDRFIRSEHAMPGHPAAEPDEASRAVARHVLSVLPAQATVQLGIGAVPETLAQDLASRAADMGLGLIGLVSESMVPLVEAIAAAAGGPVQAVELMGGPALMAWAADNPIVEMRSSRRVHDPVSLSALPAFVSVNGAVAVDLRGQVVSESVKGAVIAGVGGGPDFAEGAYLSERGLRVIALRSTTRDGSSCIVARHDPRDAIAAPHHGVDVVVTEHGVAHLRGRTVRERAEALIAIAAPEHRDALAAASVDSQQGRVA
ncbi:acetyl-CoA hydrolase/transferase family protein [Microbacterium sp.]|uniref:acetyl-CoA hydrolase/transferase family protein n=1 Tax=Microbacterium sp. TaxID=51671 RepID=UPI002CE816E7|nr:acetyl-CoA hydrolase/transferase C-terminal domain-containing protein [Microbacterium sp.]HWL79158.1 acetyl-CoA hydrolase/transferase C-terminal domain-containing protein [Microbacterium sp.]